MGRLQIFLCQRTRSEIEKGKIVQRLMTTNARGLRGNNGEAKKPKEKGSPDRSLKTDDDLEYLRRVREFDDANSVSKEALLPRYCRAGLSYPIHQNPLLSHGRKLQNQFKRKENSGKEGFVVIRIRT